MVYCIPSYGRRRVRRQASSHAGAPGAVTLMVAVLLDSNIYDILAQDLSVRARINLLIDSERLTIIATRTVTEELAVSPFGGLPNFFPIELTGNTVAFAGIMCAGDRLGSGEVYVAHLGKSQKRNDALIVDAAASKADWLVSEDGRLRHRARQIPLRCRILGYVEFVTLLNTI
jgi:hypothetical protein